jgi:hypothetical protein
MRFDSLSAAQYERALSLPLPLMENRFLGLQSKWPFCLLFQLSVFLERSPSLSFAFFLAIQIFMKPLQSGDVALTPTKEKY